MSNMYDKIFQTASRWTSGLSQSHSAALSQSLYDYYQANPDHFSLNSADDSLRINNSAYPFMLICLGLSGIQGYLSGDVTASSVKSLKQRSASLQALADAVTQRITSGLPATLTPGHLIYSGGGKSFLLAPNTEAVSIWLDQFHHDLQKELMEEPKAELYFNLSRVAFRYSDVSGDDNDCTFSQLWSRAEEQLSYSDSNRFRSLITGGGWYDKLFNPSCDGAVASPAAVTGEEPVPEHTGMSGVVRIDVDNLQEVMQGCDLPALLALSSMIDTFFSDGVNTIWSQERFRDHITIIYSGGDDLLAVGHWRRVIDFASAVRDAFSSFDGNDRLTLSAGIELMSPRFPFTRAVRAACEAEMLSKSYATADGSHKNAVTLLGVTMNWEREWTVFSEYREKIYTWLKSKSVTRGTVMYILRCYEVARHMEKSRSGNRHAWRWQAAYNINSRQLKLKGDQAKYEAYEELKRIILTEVGDERVRFDIFALACRVAEMKLRETKNR
jgi:CRISPR/Cas system-associated protein Cas10 (large subunit of type III CRISPR-Cas system)